MTLCLQDPTIPNSPYLHESILAATTGADRGAAVFAFATRAGAELLFSDVTFRNFLEDAAFTLIVGLDEVTNLRTLDFLVEVQREFDRLTMHAFYHRRPSLFHPKYCWFTGPTGGTLIVGSGNLTAKALRNNWEAYTASTVNRAGGARLVRQWTNWRTAVDEFLRPIDDPEVRLRAAQNIIVRQAQRAAREEQEEDQEPAPDNSQILIAEIPKASTRWNQANFDKANFENFFGMTAGANNLRAVLRHVAADGTLGPIESRPGVSVQSKNYRFELGAAQGLAYPDQDRPIAVFLRVAPRNFVYRLFMPGDDDYAPVRDFVVANWHGRADRMRRVLTDLATLQAAYPAVRRWPGISQE